MEGFIIYPEWVEMIEMLPQEKQMPALKAIADYCTRYEMPSKEDGLIYLLILGIKPAVDAQKQNVENGKKGGRPKKLAEETQKTPFSEKRNSKNPLSELKTPFSESKTEKERDKEPSSPTPPLTETEKEKDKENINYVDIKESEKERISTSPSTPSFPLLSMSVIEDELMASPLWVESMCYKYSLDREQLAVQVHGFIREWIERGDDHKELKDAKRHADALLNIRQRDGCLAAAPHWNEFLRDLMLRYVDDVGYDYELVAAFGKHYMQDVGGGKPYFLGIPKFEERLKEIMTAFKAEYKQTSDECTDQPGGRAESA